MRRASAAVLSTAGGSGRNRAMFSATLRAGICTSSWNTMPIPSRRASWGDPIRTGLPSW